jgi:bifunctional ADP-heptose synthase (sugar kinase/adenylyltransferase)
MASNVKNNLESFGCIVDFITNDKEKLIKRRIVDQKSNQQLLREDIGLRVDPISFSTLNLNYDAIVISDYDKGLLTKNMISNLCDNYNGYIFVDTKKKDLSCFKNCIIKYNEDESKKIINYGINCEEIVTKGKNGATWNGIDFKAPTVELHDVTGAGDVFLASLCVVFLMTNDMKKTIDKSIFLASRSVEHIGVYKLTEGDIDEICD